MRLNLQRRPRKWTAQAHRRWRNPLVQLVTNTREMIPLHSNGRTCGTEDGMPTLRVQMNPQYDYGCKQNADGNSLFVTRHAPCDRDTTSESELPPALRDEELSRTHPVSFGEIETTTCNATPVHHRANYAHWKATFRSSLRTWQSSGVIGSCRCWTWARLLGMPHRHSCDSVFLRSNASPRFGQHFLKETRSS